MTNLNISGGSRLWWRMLVFGLVSVRLASGVTVRFAEDEYTVSPGESLTILSMIDLAAGEEDLFSYGVALLHDGEDAGAVQFISATVPAGLDFNGPAGAGALTVVAMGFAGIKGTIDSSNNPLLGYQGPEFAQFRVQFSEPGTYTMRSDFFNTLGPTEAVFVTTSGAVLDARIEFDTVVVTVVPEPGVTGYLVLGWLLLRRRRRS